MARMSAWWRCAQVIAWLARFTAVGGCATGPLALGAEAPAEPARLRIEYPLDGAVFPPGFPPPAFVWEDASPEANAWRIEVTLADGAREAPVVTRGDEPAPAPEAALDEMPEPARAYELARQRSSARRWRPGAQLWAAIQRGAVQGAASVAILGLAGDRVVSRGAVSLRTASDPVGAPIFYRDLPLPFLHAYKNAHLIRWRLGDATSASPPPTLLKNMEMCANCHSFTPDGKTLAMDVDYGSDKGSYVITPISPQTVLTKDKIISWSDYRREDNELTFGLLSQISPDGRYVISTVKDRSVFFPVDDLLYSQRFFPIKGILVVYDRQTKEFFPLPGADDPRYVQTNPTWSPDGQAILFARGEARELRNLKDRSAAVIAREEATEFFEGGKKYRYDLYRIPFNAGKGGTPAPLEGASANGRSNYFARFSPDGRWVVFCQADSFMLLQPDSLLYIMPAGGGEPRQMRCNLPGKMNSWHSWSPNGRWLVFASKANGPYTQLWLAHVDERGEDAPPVLLEHFTAPDRAANIPEFVNLAPAQFAAIREEFADYHTHFRLGLERARRGELITATTAFRQVVQERPDHLDGLYNLALCLAKTGRWAEAIPHTRKVLQLSPGHTPGRRLLGGLLCRAQEFEEGIKLLEALLAEQPGDLVAANTLAWALATSPDPRFRDGARAVELAEMCCKATNHAVVPMLDSLAAAYAEAGRFQAAIEAARRAIAAAARGPAMPDRQEREARLKLYQTGRPYHQPPIP